jgi:hypothetical protein
VANKELSGVFERGSILHGRDEKYRAADEHLVPSRQSGAARGGLPKAEPEIHN